MAKISKKAIICLVISILFFLLFAAFTAVVMLVDVQAIGPENSSIGLATLNRSVFDKLGENGLWYEATEILGLIPIAFACGFALLGAAQAIKRKSILKVDPEILLLGAFYVLVGIAYLSFEIIEINYRPILIEGELEASYPSSHTILSCCIMITAIYMINKLMPRIKALIFAADAVCVLVTAVIVIGRLLSGAHWFSDIIAGVLISTALITLYYASVFFVKDKINSKSKNKTEENL